MVVALSLGVSHAVNFSCSTCSCVYFLCASVSTTRQSCSATLVQPTCCIRVPGSPLQKALFRPPPNRRQLPIQLRLFFPIGHFKTHNSFPMWMGAFLCTMMPKIPNHGRS